MIYTHPERVYPVRFDSIVESVRQKILARSQVGIQKYGTTMERKDLDRIQWLKHAQEEAMDLAVYLERCIQEEYKK
jgi:hypothetical protein